MSKNSDNRYVKNLENLCQFALKETLSLCRQAARLDKCGEWDKTDHVDAKMSRIANWSQHGFSVQNFQDTMASYPNMRHEDGMNLNSGTDEHYWIMPNGSIISVDNGHYSSVGHVLDNVMGDNGEEISYSHPLRGVSRYKAFAEGVHDNDGNGAIRVYVSDGDIEVIVYHAASPAQMKSMGEIVKSQAEIGQFGADYDNDLTGTEEFIRGWGKFQMVMLEERKYQDEVLSDRAELAEIERQKEIDKSGGLVGDDAGELSEPDGNTTGNISPQSPPRQKRYDSPMSPFFHDERLDKLGIQDIGTKKRNPNTTKFDPNYPSTGD